MRTREAHTLSLILILIPISLHGKNLGFRLAKHHAHSCVGETSHMGMIWGLSHIAAVHLILHQIVFCVIFLSIHICYTNQSYIPFIHISNQTVLTSNNLLDSKTVVIARRCTNVTPVVASHSLKARKSKGTTAIRVLPLVPRKPHPDCVHHGPHDLPVDALEHLLGIAGVVAMNVQEATLECNI